MAETPTTTPPGSVAGSWVVTRQGVSCRMTLSLDRRDSVSYSLHIEDGCRLPELHGFNQWWTKYGGLVLGTAGKPALGFDRIGRDDFHRISRTGAVMRRVSGPSLLDRARSLIPG